MFQQNIYLPVCWATALLSWTRQLLAGAGMAASPIKHRIAAHLFLPQCPQQSKCLQCLEVASARLGQMGGSCIHSSSA